MKQLGERDRERVSRIVSVIREGGPFDTGYSSLSDETARSTIERFGLDCYNYGDGRGFIKGTMTGVLMFLLAVVGVSWLTDTRWAPVPQGYHVEYVSDREPLARIDE